ncbi:hypothetical protein KR222_005089 [Zaprionus bogoriensis]|nr:hypothetical protein KR222_005089 [Zaprionus bogoriensis]
MAQVCRVCRDDNVTLVDIFCERTEPHDEPSLAEMLSECTSCEVIRDDPLPQKMCMACVLAAQNCFRFKRKCEQSHRHFWQLLGGVEILKADDDWRIIKEESSPAHREQAQEQEQAWADFGHDAQLDQADMWDFYSCDQPFIECEVKFETSASSKCSSPPGETLDKLVLGLVKQEPKAPHACATCGKEFPSKQKLSLHQRFHSRKREHKCPHCPKEFVNPGNLADHIRAHTGERPYKCPHCVKAFTQRGRLNEHIRTHTGERPFKCVDCPKTFASAGNLTVHKRIHTGERPYGCNQCHATYVQPGALQRHMRVHTADRPYKCAICLKPFPSTSYLKRHMSSHPEASGEDYMLFEEK